MQNRVRQLRESFPRNEIDSMVIMKPENRRYISGFTGSAGIVFISETESFLLTDFRYIEQAEQESDGFKIIRHADKIMDTLKEIVINAGSSRIGFEKDFLTFGNYEMMKNVLPKCEFIPTEGNIEKQRAQKDNEEIGLIEDAVRIADLAFDHMCSVIKPGISEQDAAVELEYFMRKNGSQKNSFPPIVASGPRASLPHAQPTERLIQHGDMVKMDFGATYKGYCSDLTRTVFIGNITDEQRKVYRTVLDAQLQALDAIAPGRSGIDIDKIARDTIAGEGYGDRFGHGLGHGVGLYIHESPRLSQTSTDTLAQGNVVTVEPGIYIPGWGGVRIEDMVVLTEDGHRNLTGATKDIIVI